MPSMPPNSVKMTAAVEIPDPPQRVGVYEPSVEPIVAPRPIIVFGLIRESVAWHLSQKTYTPCTLSPFFVL